MAARISFSSGATTFRKTPWPSSVWSWQIEFRRAAENKKEPIEAFWLSSYRTTPRLRRRPSSSISGVEDEGRARPREKQRKPRRGLLVYRPQPFRAHCDHKPADIGPRLSRAAAATTTGRVNLACCVILPRTRCGSGEPRSGSFSLWKENAQQLNSSFPAARWPAHETGVVYIWSLRWSLARISQACRFLGYESH